MVRVRVGAVRVQVRRAWVARREYSIRDLSHRAVLAMAVDEDGRVRQLQRVPLGTSSRIAAAAAILAQQPPLAERRACKQAEPNSDWATKQKSSTHGLPFCAASACALSHASRPSRISLSRSASRTSRGSCRTSSLTW